MMINLTQQLRATLKCQTGREEAMRVAKNRNLRAMDNFNTPEDVILRLLILLKHI
jgi:hypothetical protein